MSDTAGSLLDVSINGVTYHPAFDANAARQHSIFLNERIAYPGGSMLKKTLQIALAEGIVVIATVAEQDQLRNWAEGTSDLTLAYTDAGGNSFQAVGSINLEPMESEENRVSLSLQPRNGWTSVLA